MSGALIMASQQQVRFRELDNTNHIALQAPEIVSADQTITLPDQTGTVVTTGDNGSVTSTMILDGTILNANISASAAIADTKLATISTAGKVSGTAITSGTIATSGELRITNIAPTVRLTESDGTATHSQTMLVRDSNGFEIQTRSSAGVFLSSDYRMPSNASGATDHIWRIANTEKARLNSAGLTVVNDLTISDKIIHAGDTNTAIRFPAADTVTVETNGAERVRVDSSGRLLVGPAASSIPTFGTDGGLQLHNLANSSGAQLSIVKFNTDTGAGTLILGKSKSATVAAGAVVANNDSLGNIVFVGDDGTDLGSSGAQITCQVDGTPGANDMPGRLMFSTTSDGASTSTERMRITSAGLVGIGTSAPGKLLEVSSSTDATIRINDPATVGTVDRYIGGVEYYTNDSSGGAKVACSIKGYHVDISGNGRLQFATGNETTAMTIDGSQRVGIGTTSPGSLLHLSTDVANGIQLQRTGSFPSLCKIFNSGSLLLFEQNSSGISFQTGSTPTEKLRIDSSGRLLVGTSTNSAVSTLVLQGNSTSSVGASFLFLQRGVSVPGTNDSLGVLTFGNNASNLGPTERLRITSAGLVGIGTGAPAEILALRSSSSAIQIDTKRSNTTYGNAEILLGSPRSDTADGSTVAGRGLLSCLGNSTNTTGIVWLQAATASLATQLTDTDLKTKQCGIRLASDGSFEHWSSGSQRLKIDSSGRLLVGTSSAQIIKL
jgi:hypothetical protein